MEKIKSSVILILVFSFLVFSFSFTNPNTVSAHDESEEENVKYDLPYPGILPNNPLYVLKAVRDKIVSFLISDPMKKAEFNLLLADKRLNASLYLFDSSPKDEKNINLAESTISKAENYFHQALENLRQAKSEGIDTQDLARKLLSSSKKHQEVIKSIEKRVKGDMVQMFVLQRERAEEFEKMAESLLPKE